MATQHIRPYGMHPLAFEAYLKAQLHPSRIGQTIGHAAASAGTHAQDGDYEGVPYCGATDLHIADLGGDQVKTLLSALADAGFAAYYRRPGFDHWPSGDARHVHAIYGGCRMKGLLQTQIHDWVHGRNGLMSHAAYEFWQPSEAQGQIVRALFLAHNPA